MSENKTPSDVLAALLFLSGQTFFESDQNKLGRAVFTVRKSSPLLNKEFGFSMRGVEPQSQTLDQAWANLRFVRLLRIETPEMSRVYLDRQAREYISGQVLPRFSAAELEELRRAATVVREQCGATCEAERAV